MRKSQIEASVGCHMQCRRHVTDNRMPMVNLPIPSIQSVTSSLTRRCCQSDLIDLTRSMLVIESDAWAHDIDGKPGS